MIVKCKLADPVCPKGLDICCAVCESRADCVLCCECHDHQNCPDAKVIRDDLILFQSAVPNAIRDITDLIKLKKRLDDQEKELKAKLTKAMETFGVKSFENDLIKMTYVAPTTRSTIDGTRLKKDHPDIAEQYTKVSDVSASVRVTLKGGGQ